LDDKNDDLPTLVGGIPAPLKNMSSSVGMMKFPIYGKMFQTTNRTYLIDGNCPDYCESLPECISLLEFVAACRTVKVPLGSIFYGSCISVV
jgi:hypothetical protein